MDTSEVSKVLLVHQVMSKCVKIRKVYVILINREGRGGGKLNLTSSTSVQVNYNRGRFVLSLSFYAFSVRIPVFLRTGTKLYFRNCITEITLRNYSQIDLGNNK